MCLFNYTLPLTQLILMTTFSLNVLGDQREGGADQKNGVEEYILPPVRLLT